MKFFDDKVLLHTPTAIRLYHKIKDLPIIDYHCHLDQNKIKANDAFSDIGELWLAGDHYKWRAMRLCGVDEEFITGKASFHDKFLKYAEIVPQLIGNPLYYWTHLELKQIFGICEPLNAASAEQIYRQANEKLKTLSVRKLLNFFNVEYIATTDDPCDDLNAHGVYGKTTVAPTFRPDKLYSLDGGYLERLGNAAGIAIKTLDDFLRAISIRLDYFVAHGCKITDHGFERFPNNYIDYNGAVYLFNHCKDLTEDEKEAFFGFLLVWLAKEYAKRNLTMQIHFAVVRNNNTEMFIKCGADSGFDLIGERQSVKPVIKFLNQFRDNEHPKIILYTLNDSNLAEIAAVTGAFRNVRMGAAWWLLPFRLFQKNRIGLCWRKCGIGRI